MCCSFRLPHDGKGHRAAINHYCTQLGDTRMRAQFLTVSAFHDTYHHIFSVSVFTGFIPSMPHIFALKAIHGYSLAAGTSGGQSD